MRHPLHHSMHHVAAVLGLAVLGAAAAAAQNSGAGRPGDVVQSVPPAVSQNQKLPKLDLTDEQRARIKQVLSTRHTEVEFHLKSTKPTQGFSPTVGAKIPPGLKANALPPPLTDEMPALKRYTYLKFKGEVLIVDPMTGKIVDMFAEG